jgi:hypothetical protein
MRLSKTAWLILGAGIFVIALAVLVMLYAQQADEEQQAEESLASAKALLPQLVAEREDLQSQLNQLEDQLVQEVSALEQSIAKFPEDVESIEYDEELFMIAHDYDLEVVQLTASEPRDEVVDETIIYLVTTFEIMVSPVAVPPEAEDAYRAYCDDAIANFLDFINTVVNGEYFTTATVAEVTWEIPDITETERPVAIIKLLIYSYESYEGE